MGEQYCDPFPCCGHYECQIHEPYAAAPNCGRTGAHRRYPPEADDGELDDLVCREIFKLALGTAENGIGPAPRHSGR
ncbi:hypothetical protein SDC9_116845 [bioreactor metagenome]|uniref:Uncharacterized protein n=1 Tax=bioreactor metagenome TaxID=1076179 RepID=A0A645BXJ1_9ZZZZ